MTETTAKKMMVIHIKTVAITIMVLFTLLMWRCTVDRAKSHEKQNVEMVNPE